MPPCASSNAMPSVTGRVGTWELVDGRVVAGLDGDAVGLAEDVADGLVEGEPYPP